MTRLLAGRAGPWGLSSQTLYFSDEKAGSQRDQGPTWSHTESVIGWNKARPQSTLAGSLTLPTQCGLSGGVGVVCTHSHVDPTGSGPQLCLSSGRTWSSSPARPARKPTQEVAGCFWPIRFRDPSLSFRTGWLGVRETASANGSSLSGADSPALPPINPASGPQGEATLLFLSQAPHSESTWLWVNAGQRQRPPMLMAWPGFFPSWASLSPSIIFIYLFFHTCNRIY